MVTERLPHVRSASIGVWLTRGSRHEPVDHAGIAHFVEHMLFKGTSRRSAEDIAQQVDSIGGQLDAFTSKEYAGYYVKVLDEHLPLALDVLTDLVTDPAFPTEEILREQQVVLEEIKMVEDTPDDLVHELFAQQSWPDHPLGRPILGLPTTVAALDQPTLRRYFEHVYVPANFVVAAAGNIDHDRVVEFVNRVFRDTPRRSEAVPADAPRHVAAVQLRDKDLEQTHVCLGTSALPHGHDDRYAAYALNTVLGGSMSSRLFQNVREKRGLAYAVFSGLTAYRDAGALTIYAGCATEKVRELVDVVLAELQRLKREPLPADELRRAKDHLKGSFVLNLEGSSSRMSHLARQDIYAEPEDTADAMLAAVERVSADDVQRLAAQFFADGALGLTVLGAVGDLQLDARALALA